MFSIKGLWLRHGFDFVRSIHFIQLGCFLGCLVISGVSASAEVRLGAYQIPSLLQTNGGGSYDKVLAYIERNFRYNWRYKVYPAQELDQLFAEEKIDCIFPADRNFYGVSGVIQSDYFNLSRAFIYTKPRHEVLVGVESLKGKRVGARKGISYGPEIDGAKLGLIYSRSIEQNILKLVNDRVDAFIAYVPDALHAFKSMNMEPLNHAPDDPLLTIEEGFLCHNNARSRRFIRRLDIALGYIKGDGMLQRMVGKRYLKP
ncbi:MAG: hypothetical protein COB04_02985 [Gammaproteobacteria bacterium]|nr:MAG: hypothetical protein COB04_02985 [Gammaproteobacteria bacterium]